MSFTYPGGLITKTPVTPAGPYQNGAASGVWKLSEIAYWVKQGLWPTAGNLPEDPYYKYVTMLLPGDGTNGGQNNTFVDSSTSPTTVTRNGNTTQGSFSPYGSLWSNYFLSSGTSYLDIAGGSTIALGTGDFTIEFWVNPNAWNKRLFGWSTASDAGFGSEIDASGKVWIGGWNTGNYSTASVSIGAWTHIALTRASGVERLFINGTLDTSVTRSTNYSDTANLSIGRWTNTTNVLSGSISNFRLVKGSCLYTSSFTPSTTPLTAVSGTQVLTCQSNRFIDNSANAFAITVNGSPSVQRFSPFNPTSAYSTTTIGGSGYFDGTGDSLVTGSSKTSMEFTNTFTIECWFYPTAFANYKTVFEMRDDGNKQIRVQLGSSGQTYVLINANWALNNIGTAKLNSWNHFAITRTGTAGDVYAYLNGVNGYSYYTANSFRGTPTTIGAEGTLTNYFTGYITDFRMLNGTNLYPNGTTFTPPTAPLTAVSNTVFLESMQNASIIDNAMINDLETAGNAQISTAQSKFGGSSLYFDGTGDYLYSANTQAAFLGTGDFTIECWLKTSSTGSYKSILVPADVYSISGFYNFIVRSDNTIALEQGGGSTLVQSTTQVTDGNWHHVAACRSGTTTRIFVDGVLEGTLSSDTYSYGISTVGNYVGTYQPAIYNFNGYIDDLRITKGYARYTSSFTPPTQAFFTY